MVRRREDNSLNGIAKLAELRLDGMKIVPVTDPDFEAKYPALFSILMNYRVDSEHFVDPPVLSFSNSSGDWRAALAVSGLRAYGKRLYATFAEALEGLERELTNQTFPWEIDYRKKRAYREFEKPKK
jgi:hypothetical protein